MNTGLSKKGPAHLKSIGPPFLIPAPWCPKRPPRSLKTAQEASKTAPGSPQDRPRGLRDAQRSLHDAQDGPKTVQYASKTPQEASKSFPKKDPRAKMVGFARVFE